jgi:hypothetical protein
MWYKRRVDLQTGTYHYSVNFGIGSIVSMILSAVLNHSFWWAILHMFFGWFYVLYAILCRSHSIIPAFKAMFT